MSAQSFTDLAAHVGHNIEVVTYGDANAAVECVDCSTVLTDFDREPDPTGPTPPAQHVSTDYRVTWQIDVEAGDESWGAANPVEAAVRAALTLMGPTAFDPTAAAVFDVYDPSTGLTHRIDLSNNAEDTILPAPTGKCQKCNGDTSGYAPEAQALCAVCANPEGE